MSAVSRKLKEYSVREELLLDIAYEILENHGFDNLTLEKLAARSDFSKGTIYNHFSNKEDLFMCVLFGQAPHIIGKTSKKQLEQRLIYEKKVTAILDSIVLDALNANEIKSPLVDKVEAISFINWAMSFGTTALLQSAKHASSISRIKETDVLFMQNICILLDGLEWVPLSKDFDYLQTSVKLNKLFTE